MTLVMCAVDPKSNSLSSLPGHTTDEGHENRHPPGPEESVMKPSSKDEVAGRIHEVKGAVKEKAGKLTNNPDLEAAGSVEKMAGKIRGRCRTTRLGRHTQGLLWFCSGIHLVCV